MFKVLSADNQYQLYFEKLNYFTFNYSNILQLQKHAFRFFSVQLVYQKLRNSEIRFTRRIF